MRARVERIGTFADAAKRAIIAEQQRAGNQGHSGKKPGETPSMKDVPLPTQPSKVHAGGAADLGHATVCALW